KPLEQRPVPTPYLVTEHRASPTVRNSVGEKAALSSGESRHPAESSRDRSARRHRMRRCSLIASSVTATTLWRSNLKHGHLQIHRALSTKASVADIGPLAIMRRIIRFVQTPGRAES